MLKVDEGVYMLWGRAAPTFFFYHPRRKKTQYYGGNDAGAHIPIGMIPNILATEHRDGSIGSFFCQEHAKADLSRCTPTTSLAKA
jgi:hypothetical protein